MVRFTCLIADCFARFYMLIFFPFSYYRKAHSIEGPTGHPTIDGIRAKVIQAREQAHSIEGPKGHLTLKGLRAELAQARELRKSSPESKELPLRPAARS